MTRNVPVVVVALIAVAILMPESHSAERPRVDFAGVAISSAGLITLTYGCIKAGQDGWGGAAIATIIAGAALLAGFAAWERVLTSRGQGVRPLVELALFRSAGFTCFLPRRARGGAAGQQEPVPARSGETSSERAELGI